MTSCSAIAVRRLFGAVIHAEIEFRQIPLKVLAIDVLVHADDAALEHAKEAFQRIGMHIAARPLKLRVVNGFVARSARKFVNGLRCP